MYVLYVYTYSTIVAVWHAKTFKRKSILICVFPDENFLHFFSTYSRHLWHVFDKVSEVNTFWNMMKILFKNDTCTWKSHDFYQKIKILLFFWKNKCTIYFVYILWPLPWSCLYIGYLTSSIRFHLPDLWSCKEDHHFKNRLRGQRSKSQAPRLIQYF